MGYLALAKQVEAELKMRKQEGTLSWSPPPTPKGADVNPALLEAEAVLFRLWWRTLPDKPLARQNWAAEIAYYAAQKGFSGPFIETLKVRIADLWRE